MADGTSNAQDGGQAQTPAQTPASQTGTLTEADVQKRINDAHAVWGREHKAETDELAALRTENAALKRERLADAAKGYGLTIEQVDAAGITDPAKLASLAAMFGKAATSSAPAPSNPSTPPSPPRTDSGATAGGGGGLTPEKVRGMSPQDIVKNYKEISKLPLQI